MVTFWDGEHTGKLPGRLVRNPASVGLVAGGTGVKAASTADESDTTTDLREYAAELSEGGGASALARVLRSKEQALEGPPQSRL